MILATALLVVCVWWMMLRWRLVPVSLASAWFFLVNTVIIFPVAAFTAVFTPLRHLGVSQPRIEQLSIGVVAAAFRLVWYLNPQIRLYIAFEGNVEGQPQGWHDVPEHRLALVGNHVSFWDIYTFLIAFPLRRVVNIRTMLKASLLSVPFFGGAMRRQGHFPVYFTSDEDGNFQVDKERQAAVQVGVDRHVSADGNIALFPEGALNKNPKTLQPFRYGTFHTIMEHRMQTYYGVIVGNEVTWPRKSLFGGRPADICARVGAFPIDFETEDAKTVATRMQAHMQRVYNVGLRDLEAIKAGKVPQGYVQV